jgi:hypothetical protein
LESWLATPAEYKRLFATPDEPREIFRVRFATLEKELALTEHDVLLI